ncbi:type II toxin-antitoxin system Phd/YefM family antitoxin [Leucothrix pacifica]|uniref:Antitoxin n=1 Tax=Leucothrix pacifica TaxID=1247513 RepID=A0A317C7Z8_9GAMM|nr:type II toxin-antitoxin system Phd/YefM family antitoxin [Leucothrix pacifica]PWQ92430.1 type II toxin-antitoxin system Phd/YefM family antitoxin [Leucothrix pacifica]
MKVMSEKDAKNSFDELMDTAQHEPVLITKRDRSVGIFMSLQEAERIPELKDKLLKHMNKTVQSPLLSMLGAHKDNKVFKSADDADKFIKQLRDEWA